MQHRRLAGGKGDDNGTLLNDDFGRARETRDAADRYKFRTPTLLNVEVTGPWGHAGGYTTLENMVRHMLNPVEAIANYDFTQLDANANVQFSNLLTNTQFALNQLEANRANDVAGVHRNVAFNDGDVTDLVAFLKTLTDPCVKDSDCMSPWIPDANDVDPDSLRVDAVDNNGVSS